MHEYGGKLYFISNNNQLTQLDPLSFRCEPIGLSNLEAIESNDSFIATLSHDGELNLLYAEQDPKTLKINRNCSFLKVATTESHVVVVGWREQTKEAVFLLYDSNLKFRDEITVKQGSILSQQLTFQGV